MASQKQQRQEAAMRAWILQEQARGNLSRDPREALGQVQQRVAQVAYERELLGYAATLSPQHVAYVEHLYAQGGPQAVAAALQAAGLGVGAIQVAVATMEQVGLDGLKAAAAEGIQREVERVNIEASIDKATPKETDEPTRAAWLEKGPLAAALRDPDLQRQAAAIYAQKGIAPAQGRSALEDMFALLGMLETSDGLMVNAYRKPGEAKLTSDEQLAAFAAHIGEPVEAVRKLYQSFETSAAHTMLAGRLAERDHRPGAPKVTLSKEAAERAQREARNRAVLERKADELQASEAQRRARLPDTRATPAKPAGRPHPQEVYERRRAALSEAADRIERGESTREPAPEADPYESSRHAALSEAYDQLDAEGGESDQAVESTDTGAQP